MSSADDDTTSHEDRLRRLLTALFESQHLAVLATHRDGQPYCSLVGVAVSDDLQDLLFATTRSTRKFENLSADDRVALMLDNRGKGPDDFHDAAAVTALGRVREVAKEHESPFLARYLGRHPYLRDFVLSPNCALLRVHVEKYVVVQRFQEVMELELS